MVCVFVMEQWRNGFLCNGTFPIDICNWKQGHILTFLMCWSSTFLGKFTLRQFTNFQKTNWVNAGLSFNKKGPVHSSYCTNELCSYGVRLLFPAMSSIPIVCRLKPSSPPKTRAGRICENVAERFPNAFRKTNTKVITPTNHNRSKQRDGQIGIPSNFQ